MAEPCGRTFDESLLSGYVDGALVQADEQRVRIHLEDCRACRAIVGDLRQTREVTMSTSFKVPEDLQWSERPRSAASRFSLGAGWLLVLVWLAGVSGRAAWEAWHAGIPTGEELLAFAGLFGIALLFIGVLIDRLKSMKTDRYREVQK